MTADLVAFLRARLDEEFTEAQRAGQATGPIWFVPPDHPGEVLDSGGGRFTAGSPSRAKHIARHDPARVLAEIDAKRRLLHLHGSQTGQPWCRVCGQEVPCATLRLVALPYAGHPEWREEWRP